VWADPFSLKVIESSEELLYGKLTNMYYLMSELLLKERTYA